MKAHHLFAFLIALAVTMTTFSAKAGRDIFIDLGRGSVPVYIPDNYDPEQPTPLVMLLHGYGGSGTSQEAYFRFKPLAEEFNFIYTYPDGSVDRIGSRFWNATDACCDFFFSGNDDSAYLRAIIDEIRSLGNIDAQRIFIVGLSNGGFMAHRMACDHADTVSAITSVAGSSWDSFELCSPSEPVHSLRIHGTLDDIIPYDGSCIAFYGCWPGAIPLSLQWRDFNQCDKDIFFDPQWRDLDYFVPGNETLVARAEQGCLPGGSSQLWTMLGSGHVPFPTPNLSRGIIEYFFSHPGQVE